MSIVETKPAPYSWPAIAGFTLACGSIALGFVGRPLGQVAAVLALVVALWARVGIKHSHGRKSGRGLASWGIALAGASAVIFLAIAPAVDRVRDAANRMNSL